MHASLLHSQAVERTASAHGGWLLPQAYPEGAPIHPSYPAAHAVIAGVCVTVLKGFFDESFVLPEPVFASSEGDRLLPWKGAALTVGGELDKIASNVAIGRDFAGVHYRSDSTQGLLVGEELAIRVLREVGSTSAELYTGFSLRRFDGRRIAL